LNLGEIGIFNGSNSLWGQFKKIAARLFEFVGSKRRATFHNINNTQVGQLGV